MLLGSLKVLLVRAYPVISDILSHKLVHAFPSFQEIISNGFWSSAKSLIQKMRMRPWKLSGLRVHMKQCKIYHDCFRCVRMVKR